LSINITSLIMRLKHLFAAHDMSEGAPWKRITEFAVPMLIGNLAQQLYNAVDSAVVGYYVGDNALSAVGSSMPIFNLLLALFVGISTGAGIIISQYYGAGNREALSRSVGNCITLAAIVSVLTMAIGLLITRPLLEFLDTPSTIIDWCEEYLRIFFYGAAGFTFYNILSGILRGLGDSFSALGFLLIATALNIGLDFLFVGALGMPGVSGVSLATVIAQSVSAILCYIKLMHTRDIFDLDKKNFRLHKKTTMDIIKLGLPSGITQAIMAMAMLVVQNLTNKMGEMVIACSVIVMRVDGFAMMPNMTFGQAMTVYTGQNVGAGRLDRVQQGIRQGMYMAVGTSVVITICLLLFGRALFDIFTDTQELIDLAMNMMIILAAGYIAMAVTQVLGGVMRGGGDTMTPMWLSFITTIIIRIPIAYGLAYLTRSEQFPDGSPAALFTSLLLAWCSGAVLHYFFFRRGKWRKTADEAIKRAQAKSA